MQHYQKLSKLSLVALLVIFTLTISSCCKEDKYSLSNLKVCDQLASELGDQPECPSSISTLNKSVDYITASAVAHRSDASTKVIFRLVNKATGDVIDEASQTLGSIGSDIDGDECSIFFAYSWQTNSGGDWPVADLTIECELDGDSDDFMSVDFEIR